MINAGPAVMDGSIGDEICRVVEIPPWSPYPCSCVVVVRSVTSTATVLPLRVERKCCTTDGDKFVTKPEFRGEGCMRR